MRRKRPPALSLPAADGHAPPARARSLSLLALDSPACTRAIFTRAVLKAALRGDAWDAEHAVAGHGLRRLRVPRHGAAVRPLRPLRGPRRAPRLHARSSASLFQVTVVALIFARRQRPASSRLLHLLRHPVLRARLRVARCAGSTSRSAACCCAPPATTAAPCSSARASTSRPSRTRCGGSGPHAPIEVVGFISLTPRPDNGLRSLGSLDDLARDLRARTGRRGDHRRPRLPAAGGRRAGRPAATGAACACGRAVDDGDPDPPRGVRARARRCRCSSSSRRSSRASTSSLKRIVRHRRCRAACWSLLSPLLLRDARSRCGSPRAGRSSTARCAPGIGGVPFACLKFRTMYDDADARQAELEELQRGRAARSSRCATTRA